MKTITRQGLLQARAVITDRAEQIIDAACSAGKALQGDELAEVAKLHEQTRQLDAEIERFDRHQERMARTLRPIAS